MPFELDPTVDLTRAKKVKLGDYEVAVAPLTLRRIMRAAEMLPELNAASTSDNLEKLVDFVMLGLERTYPTLTRDELLDSDATVEQLRGVVAVLVEKAAGSEGKTTNG